MEVFSWWRGSKTESFSPAQQWDSQFLYHCPDGESLGRLMQKSCVIGNFNSLWRRIYPLLPVKIIGRFFRIAPAVGTREQRFVSLPEPREGYQKAALLDIVYNPFTVIDFFPRISYDLAGTREGFPGGNETLHLLEWGDFPSLFCSGRRRPAVRTKLGWWKKLFSFLWKNDIMVVTNMD